jgi:hypothetical protein
MVLPHACALEKEFNEHVAILGSAGHTQPEAEELANDDVSLDRFIALAPLCTYGELAPERHAGVQTGARLGAFPVPENALGGIPSAWVDLRRISTTDITLLEVEPMRLASLSALAQAHLQAALAKHWAYRDLSRYDELRAYLISVSPPMCRSRPARRCASGLRLKTAHNSSSTPPIDHCHRRARRPGAHAHTAVSTPDKSCPAACSAMTGRTA